MAGIGVADLRGDVGPCPFGSPVDADAGCNGSASAMRRQMRRMSMYSK